ncbi:unnamed protein product [Arabis nemorensis]|uniref:Phytocyanin domain-containing protein n=1 Tax=Arabis nemorensis TaxID=586526 RepID=A0A565CQ68_9BRAS|nr:unnamed protein product [Arabis nemorensis]
MVMIMKSLCFSFVILASFATFFTVSDAWRFNVGGNGVWAINPQENYNTWAERNRFQVNDTLYFKYAKGSDSVQQVMKADFDGCNVRNPIKNFDNGESEVTLDRSGPFYFISGNQDHCKKGQKLIVVVLAVRNHPTVPISPAKPPSMAQPPKSHSPVSPIAPAKPPTKAQPPKSPSPVSPAKPPTTAQPPKSPSPVSPVKPPSQSQPPKSSISPASPPSKPQPPKSSSPVSHSPVVSPSHAPTISPATPPPSPPKSPSPTSSTSPPSPSPDQTPTSPPPEQTPPTSPSPSGTTPTTDNITPPAPSPKSSASGVAVTSVMTTVLSIAFIVFMFA